MNFKTLVKDAGLTACAGAAALFAAPAVLLDIRSIGNMAGLGFAASGAAGIIFSKPLASAAKKLSASKSGRFMLAAAGTPVLLFTGYAAVLSCCVLKCSFPPRPGKSKSKSKSKRHSQSAAPDALIVLGCKVNDDQPSATLKARIETAAAYLAAHPDTYCIVSGGKGSDEGISEAECMYRGLCARGVNPAHIIREDRSTTTEENFQFSRELMESCAAFPLPRKLGVVTSDFHEFRSCGIARAAGFTPVSIPARTKWWIYPTYFVREWFAYANDRVRLVDSME